MTLTDALSKKSDEPPQRSPSNGGGNSHGHGSSNFARCLAYVARMDPAISGAGGHNATLDVVRVCKGFDLDQEQTLDILRTYNQRCEPPWSERELLHKSKQLGKLRVASGYILDQSRDWRPQIQAARTALVAPPGAYDAPADVPGASGAWPPPPPDEPSNHGGKNGNDGAPAAQASPQRSPRTVRDIVADWREEGRTERVDVGIAGFDALCGGGMPMPRRMLITGAPGAGKTYLLTWVAEQFLMRLSDLGYVVGIVAIDEDDTDLMQRFAQMRGVTPYELERREEKTLISVLDKFEQSPLFFYNLDWSLEAAANDLASRCKANERPGVLFVDSIHTAWSEQGATARNAREAIEANFRVLRDAHREHRLSVITTGEMNRQGYASKTGSEDANLLASNAESRAAEFWAQTAIAVRTPKDMEGIVECTITKNRGNLTKKGVFWLKLLHETHSIIEMSDPSQNPQLIEKIESEKAKARIDKAMADANTLGAYLLKHQGIGSVALRAAVKSDIGWGTGRTNSALEMLQYGHTKYTITRTVNGKVHEYNCSVTTMTDGDRT